jgi:hypothetical protein
MWQRPCLNFYGKSTDYFVTSISMIQTKTIAMILLIAIATIGTTVGIGTAHAVLTQNDPSQGNNNNQASVCLGFRCFGPPPPGENAPGNQN